MPAMPQHGQGSFDYTSLAAGVSSAGGDYWFVAKVLKYPRDPPVLDHGIEADIMSPEEE